MSEFLIGEPPRDLARAITPPPGAVLAAAALVAVGGATAATSLLRTPDLVIASLGWLAAGVLSFVLVAAHRRSVDRVRTESDSIVAEPRWMQLSTTAIPALGLLAAAANGWAIATVLSS